MTLRLCKSYIKMEMEWEGVLLMVINVPKGYGIGKFDNNKVLHRPSKYRPPEPEAIIHMEQVTIKKLASK